MRLNRLSKVKQLKNDGAEILTWVHQTAKPTLFPHQHAAWRTGNTFLTRGKVAQDPGFSREALAGLRQKPRGQSLTFRTRLLWESKCLRHILLLLYPGQWQT